MNRSLIWGWLACCFLLSAPSRAEDPEPRSGAEIDPMPGAYAEPPLLAGVGPGRTIHLVCLGQGSPTVILTAGLGNWSEIWRKVQPAISSKTRACAWDRPGFGLSSPSPEPQDVAHTTSDLEKALKAAHIAGPYLLVGHSLGGYETLLFADRHPRDVAGMVLVDPSFPDQQRVIAEVSPITAKMTEQFARETISSLRDCAAKVKSGEAKPGDADLADCADENEDSYPPDFLAHIRRLEADPARYLTAASTIEEAPKDSALAVNSRRNYGTMPLIVLTAGQIQKFPPDFPEEAVTAWADFVAKDWLKAHDEIAALSKRGVNLVVPDSAHYIQMIKPEAVIEAIDRVLEEARAGAKR